MPNYDFLIGNGNREQVISYILSKKQQGKFSVIDVGGSYGGWSSNVVDAIIDFNDYPSSCNRNIMHFKCDITHPDSWLEILQYVKDNGKFDFCICTHTLEDIMNPVYVCEQIQKISNGGYIAFPSKYRELSRCEGNYRGYIHHRWIFDVDESNNNVIAYPKINYIDSTTIFDRVANNNDALADLSFYWRETINVSYINGNFLGPNVCSVIRYYDNLLNACLKG